MSPTLTFPSFAAPPSSNSESIHSLPILPVPRSHLWAGPAITSLPHPTPPHRPRANNYFLGFLGEMSMAEPGAGISMGNISTHNSSRPCKGGNTQSTALSPQVNPVFISRRCIDTRPHKPMPSLNMGESGGEKLDPPPKEKHALM